ncbi:DUF411 domain-containing protein [Scytonema tolypothrichoides VB-61278]|nr:DUF411 domain-containing protein [Scytonema tolypothrichoides VB-61278]
MPYKQFIKLFIYWWQKRLRPIVITICLTAGVLGLLGSNAPMSHAQSHAQTIFPTSFLNTQLVSTTRGIQNKSATVYRSPDCTCCGGWIDHLKAQGFKIKDFRTPDIEAVKQKYNVPDKLTSCHTAIVNGYVIEGHVPAQDIKRLLQEKPNVIGLSVPQMPMGTPGMEMGNKKDPFSVLAFDNTGRTAVFNEY